MKNKIIVPVIVNSTLEKVWDAWTLEENVKIWNVPFSDWHCPFVENNVVTGGKFHFRMENLNGTEGFDYKGEYTQVIPYSKIITLQEDKRISTITFEESQGKVFLTEEFEPEEKTDLNLQREFCQSVLERFKSFVEKSI